MNCAHLITRRCDLVKALLARQARGVVGYSQAVQPGQAVRWQALRDAGVRSSSALSRVRFRPWAQSKVSRAIRHNAPSPQVRCWLALPLRTMKTQASVQLEAQL